MKNLLMLISAVIVSVFLMPLGITWSLGKSIVESIQFKFWIGVKQFLRYWGNVLKQFWFVLSYLFYHIAFALDLIWNAFSGEFIEDWVTAEEQTMFGRGEITISASIGRQENRDKLNKFGKWFSKLLDKAFKEENHCLNAYENVKHLEK